MLMLTMIINTTISFCWSCSLMKMIIVTRGGCGIITIIMIFAAATFLLLFCTSSSIGIIIDWWSWHFGLRNLWLRLLVWFYLRNKRFYEALVERNMFRDYCCFLIEIDSIISTDTFLSLIKIIKPAQINTNKVKYKKSCRKFSNSTKKQEQEKR